MRLKNPFGASSALGPDPADRPELAPSLVVSAAHSAFGAVRRVQVRVGEVTVLLAAAGDQAAPRAREQAGGRTEQDARDRAGGAPEDPRGSRTS